MDCDIIIKIIENAKETDQIDFKRAFYKSLRESDLSKDVSAFANANSNQDKYLIFGVDDKTRQVTGIDESTIPSQDNLDKYLSDTIEPFINVEIGSIEYKDHIIGYIKISNKNIDRPYIIKRDCGWHNNIHQGDIFIRKGTVTKKASRSDLNQMYKIQGTVLLRLRDDLVCIEPITIPGSIVGSPTYGRCDIEIYNETVGSILIDRGYIEISSNAHTVKRRIVHITPKQLIDSNPLQLPPGSRGVHTCLFDFESQDCVDFGFEPDGFMNDDVDIQIVLFDTDDNEYHSDIKSVTLKAKGGSLHKVNLKYKNGIISVKKRRLF